MLILPIMMFLTACRTVVSETSYVCPNLVDYSEQEQARVRAELNDLESDSQTKRFIVDYGKLRLLLRKSCEQ